MASRRLGVIVGVVVDVTLWLILSCFAFLLGYNVLGIQPYHRGFFCDDQSISYPYRDDTVSDGMAALTCVVIPALFMVSIEGAHVYNSKVRKAKGNSSLCKKYIVYIYRTVGAFLVGSVCTLLISEVIKLLGGRLRPNFMSVCSPDYSKFSCADGYVVIPDEYCKGTNQKRLIDSRKSFPSGHASLASFGMIYLVIYFQTRFIWRRSKLLLPTLQLGAICLGCWVSITRVSDNKHHWSDVIAGALLGAIGSIFTYKFISCLPHCSRNLTVTSPLPVKDPTPRNSTGNPQAVIEMNAVCQDVGP